MLNTAKQGHTVHVRSQKELNLFKIRQNSRIQHTPHLHLGKYQNQQLSLWTQHLRKYPLSQLKNHNSSQKAFNLAVTIASTCKQLTKIYGYFMINQNMVFANDNNELLIWINPNILQNKVKIYLPMSDEGQKAMIRSIISYLKLWLRCDFQHLSRINCLQQLQQQLESIAKNQNSRFRYRISHQVPAERSLSVNPEFDCRIRGKKRFQTVKFAEMGSMNRAGLVMKKNNSYNQNKIHNQTQSPQHTFSQTKLKQNTTFSNTTNTTLKFKMSPKLESYMNTTLKKYEPLAMTSTTLHQAISPQKGDGVKQQGRTYFPNKTTSNKNHIVQMIMENDTEPSSFGKNNIVIDEQKFKELQQQKMKRIKGSIHEFGQQFDQLFESNLVDKNNGIDVSRINREFQNLLS